MKNVKITNNLKMSINEMINRNDTLVNVINYLFTCDYSAFEVFEILTNYFKCNKQLVEDTLCVDFGMGRCFIIHK